VRFVAGRGKGGGGGGGGGCGGGKGGKCKMMMMGMMMMMKLKLFGEDALVYLFDFSTFGKIRKLFRYSNLSFVSANP